MQKRISERLLSYEELAALKGVTVSFLKKHKKRPNNPKGIPFRKLGATVKFYPSEFDEWVEERKDLFTHGEEKVLCAPRKRRGA